MPEAITVHVEGTQRGFAVYAEQSGNCIHWQSFPVSYLATPEEISRVYGEVKQYATHLESTMGNKPMCRECGQHSPMADGLCADCLGK